MCEQNIIKKLNSKQHGKSNFKRTLFTVAPANVQYLTTEGIPKKERQQIIESWGNWTTFLFEISCYRGLLTQFLQYHHRQLHDLEHLLGNESSETPDLLTD